MSGFELLLAALVSCGLSSLFLVVLIGLRRRRERPRGFGPSERASGNYDDTEGTDE